MPSSSFSTSRVNKTTFCIVEDDEYEEHPFIYAKLHPRANVLILSDTGCDEVSEERKHDRFIHLRSYLEQCPVSCNGNAPLNPGGKRTYIIICSHCHFDHTGGVMQFLRGGTTEIIAPAAGRDFIESDLGRNGIFDPIKRPVPYYHVTYYAQSFERLKWPIKLPQGSDDSKRIDLGITIISTPGHTPDELAWYDHDEMHLYVGDSFYEEGADKMPILWPAQGNLIEWAFSMQKLGYYIKSENAREAAEIEAAQLEDGWVSVARSVKVGCGHQSSNLDGADILARLESFYFRAIRGEIPVIKSRNLLGMRLDTWAEPDRKSKFYFEAPRQLMDDARSFFKGTGPNW